MHLPELLTKSVEDCTIEELEERVQILSKMKLTSKESDKPKGIKTNEEKRKEDLINSMSEEELLELVASLGGVK